MRKNILFIAIGMCILCNSCSNGSVKNTDPAFVDDVISVMENDGKVDLNAFEWTREPMDFAVCGDTLTITTAPHTDLWQRTYYHFRNDNAPAFQMRTKEQYFSFVVKTDFTQSHHRFDQCGIVMYLDGDNWLKASVEYENEEFQHLGSVVTNKGYSDWATTAIPADVKTMCEESSFTAVFTDMKVTECMWKAHDGQQPDTE